MSSKIGFHIQAARYPDWLKEHVARSGAKFVKIINPHEGEAQPFGPDVNYIGRLYWDGEPDKELIKLGWDGADEWLAMALPRMNAALWVNAWEGPNEPYVRTEEEAHALVGFEKRRIERLHGNYRKAVSYCFGTGNPYLSLWPILGIGLQRTDYLALHEYGMRRMDLDGWHLLRYRKVIKALRDAGHRVPSILITETGIDYNGHPELDGWRAQGFSEAEYLAQLAAYDQEILQDPEVKAILPFTWMHQGWPSFRIDRTMSGVLTDYMHEQNGRIGLGEALGNTMQQYVIPQNREAAFYLYGRAHGWEPISCEADVHLDGATYRAQVWYDQVQQIIVYTELGNWDNVRHFDREN